MINRINNTTSKANPPAKPQPSPQLPPYPITIVPPLDKRVKTRVYSMDFNGVNLLYVLKNELSRSF